MTMLRLKYVHAYLDRHGRARHYFRQRGFPTVALPGLPGSQEFNEAYAAALQGNPLPPVKPMAKGGPGSLAEAVTNWQRSPRFANLSASTQVTYRRVLGPILEKHGHRLLRELTPENAERLITQIGAERPGMANLTKAVLQTVCKSARLSPNPFDGIERYKLGTHHSWTERELAIYENRWPLGTRERLAFALLVFTTQRVGDAVRINRSDIQGNRIRVVQQKTAQDDDDAQWIAIHPALARAIAAGPTNGLTIIGDKHGRPIKAKALSELIQRAAAAAGLPERCRPHGLRKAGIRRLAEAGATTKELQSVSGHKTLREVERYSERANRAKLSAAAVAKLRDETTNKSG
jgi:enterobacteria phage integrase